MRAAYAPHACRLRTHIYIFHRVAIRAPPSEPLAICALRVAIHRTLIPNRYIHLELRRLDLLIRVTTCVLRVSSIAVVACAGLSQRLHSSISPQAIPPINMEVPLRQIQNNSPSARPAAVPAINTGPHDSQQISPAASPPAQPAEFLVDLISHLLDSRADAASILASVDSRLAVSNTSVSEPGVHAARCHPE